MTVMLYRISLVVLVTSIRLFAAGSLRANAEEPFDTVVSYTEALRAGDVFGVKSHLGGRLYERKEVLLDQNDEYPDFLRKFYQGAEFDISDQLNDLGPRGQGVRVKIRFPGGHFSENIAIVEQAPDGSWKIVDEIEAGN